jgi:hypothetical protein
MTTFAAIFLMCMAFAVLVLGRMAWRFLRDDEQPEAAGSFGRQFFGRRRKPQTLEEWLNE